MKYVKKGGKIKNRKGKRRGLRGKAKRGLNGRPLKKEIVWQLWSGDNMSCGIGSGFRGNIIRLFFWGLF